MTGRITWRGLAADYTLDEKHQMEALRLTEAFTIHHLKALFGGEIQPSPCIDTQSVSVAGIAPNFRSGISQPLLDALAPAPVYIDPEDIPFGEPVTAPPVKRSRPLSGLNWTGGRGSIHKTKKVAERRIRAWRMWKERAGWKTVKVATPAVGYFAAKDGVREAIILHEIEKSRLESSSFRLRK